MSKVLVTGASGFIGRHVCRKLAAQGATVLALGHGEWTADDSSRWGVSRWRDADVGLESMTDIMDGDAADALIHCAGSGSVSFSYASPFEDYERSVNTVAALLEFVRRSGSKSRVVITSSAAVYGDHGDVDLTETSPCAPISPYGVHKLAAEQLCASYARYFGVSVTVVRLFSVYGEGLRKQLLWDACQRFERGEREFFGTGHELRDWIHVEDAAALLRAAAMAPQSHFEVCNAGHEKASTRHVLSELGRYFAGGIEPVFNGETHTGNPRRLTADCGNAERQLGWSATVSLIEGLQRYAEWYRRHVHESKMSS